MENIILYTLIGICGVGCMARIVLAWYYKSLFDALKSMRHSKNKTAAALKEQFLLRYQAMLGVENVDFFVGRFLAERRLLGMSLTAWNGLHTQFVGLCLFLGAVTALGFVVQDRGAAPALLTMFHGIWTSALLIFVDGFCMIDGRKGALHDGLCDYLENYLKVRLEHEYKVWGKCEKEEKPSKAALEAELQIVDAKEYRKQKKQQKQKWKEESFSARRSKKQEAYAAKLEEKMRKEQERLQKREERLRKKLGGEMAPVYRAGKSVEGQGRIRQEAEMLKREVEERRKREAEAAATAEAAAARQPEAESEPPKKEESEQEQVNELLKDFLINC